MVLFLIPQAHRDIYGSKADVKRAKSYEAWAKNINELNTILSTDPETHARKRKILNQAFTEKTVRHASSFIVRHTERWIDLLMANNDVPTEDEWTGAHNMSEWNDWVEFDILGDLCFGRSFEIKEPGPNPIREIPNHVIRHVQLFYPVSLARKSIASINLCQILQSPLIEFFVWAKPKGLDYLLDLVTPEDLKMYYKFIDDSVSKRIQEEQSGKDAEKSRLDISTSSAPRRPCDRRALLQKRTAGRSHHAHCCGI
jgi:hypothetical protein